MQYEADSLALAMLLPLIMVWFRLNLPESFGSSPLLMIFVFPISLCAALGGLSAGLFATAVSAFAAAYFLIYPEYSLEIDDPYQQLNVTLLIGNGLFMSLICESLLRAQRKAKLQRDEQALTMGLLRENEQRLRLMTSCVKDYAITMLDKEGRFISWNEGAQRLKGYEEQEILHQSFKILYTAEDVAMGKPDRFLETATNQGQAEDTGLRVRKDGSTFYADVIITAIRDNKGTLVGFTKITRDISERKQAENRFIESEQRFKQLVESLPQMIWSCQPDGICDYLSPQWRAYTGTSGTEQLGYGWLEQIHPDDRELVAEQWQSSAREGKAYQAEFRIRRYDAT